MLGTMCTNDMALYQKPHRNSPFIERRRINLDARNICASIWYSSSPYLLPRTQRDRRTFESACTAFSPPRTAPPGIVCHSASITQEDGSSIEGESARLPPIKRLPLRWGIATEQGPREAMEDAVQLVEDGLCGFLFASECINDFQQFRSNDSNRKGLHA